MKNDNERIHELPKKLEKIFAALSIYYKNQDEKTLMNVLVNSQYSVKEEYDYDNWNGGTWGHAIFFKVPPEIFYTIFESITDIEQRLAKDINKIANCDREYISHINFEIQDDPLFHNWREKSGVIISRETIPSEEVEVKRIWKSGYLRAFISHKDEYKQIASALKESLDFYGISCFVAHEDIEPTKEWQNEIEKALFSMEIMIALMTNDFHNSNWTDQEIGVAFGRKVLILSIRLGNDPYGFIGKFQAINVKGKDYNSLAEQIFRLLFTYENPKIKSRTIDALVSSFENAVSFNQANLLINIISEIDSAPPKLIERLENAYKTNDQVRGAWDVKEQLPHIISRLRGNG